MKKVSFAMLALFSCLLMACGPVPACDGDGPQISFTSVPPIGSGAALSGTVCGADPASERVLVYIQVDGRWWVKPTAAQPLTPIGFFGSWSCDIVTGGVDQQATAICAYLVPASFKADMNLRPGPGDYLAVTCVER